MTKREREKVPGTAGDVEAFEEWEDEGAEADAGQEGDEGGFAEEGDDAEELAADASHGEVDAEGGEGEAYGDEFPDVVGGHDMEPPPPAADARGGSAQPAMPDAGRHRQPDTAPVFERAALDLAPDVPVQVVAVIGKRGVTMKELMELRMGQIIDLKRPPDETVDVVVAGKLFARGELVEIDGKLGVKILKLVR